MFGFRKPAQPASRNGNGNGNGHAHVRFPSESPGVPAISTLNGRPVPTVALTSGGDAANASAPPREVPPAETANFLLVPKNGRLAVTRQERESKTRGGIILPDQAQEKNCMVEVIAVCPEWYEDGVRRTSGYQIGDRLLISRYAGEEYILDNGAMKLLLVREADVLAHIKIKATATHMPDAVTVPAERPGVVLEVEDETGRGKAEFDRIPV